jgi:hypothetical protein
MSCKVQVIHPDGLAESFKGGADSTLVLSGFRTIGQYLQAAAKVLDGRQILTHA